MVRSDVRAGRKHDPRKSVGESVAAFVGSYFLVGGASFGARTVAISRQTASAAFDVTSGL